MSDVKEPLVQKFLDNEPAFSLEMGKTCFQKALNKNKLPLFFGYDAEVDAPMTSKGYINCPTNK